MNTPLEDSREWIRTDCAGCADDVRRLGLDGAVDYNLELVAERVASGDKRWTGITADALRQAIGELATEDKR